MTLVPIGQTGMAPATLRDQPAPSLDWVPLARLVVDRSYQRDLSQASRAHIRRLADGWDWSKFQPILIAPREGGVFAVVDGRHRAEAAALLGLESLPAMAVPMTHAQQAAGFAAVNRDRVSVHSLAIFKAQLAAGDPEALACQAAVAAAGAEIATSNPSALEKNPGRIYAIGLIRRMVRAGEAQAVTCGLRAIGQSDCAMDVPSWSGPVLAVWLAALARDQRFARLDLAAIFGGIDFDTLRDNCAPVARARGVSLRGLMTDAVVQRLKDALADGGSA